jgi:hypothetical protein
MEKFSNTTIYGLIGFVCEDSYRSDGRIVGKEVEEGGGRMPNREELVAWELLIPRTMRL